MDLKESIVSKYPKNRHPWELSRAESVLGLIKNNPHNLQYADIGAGDQFFTKKLVSLTRNRVYAVDTGYSRIKQKGRIIQYTDIIRIPKKSIDFVFLLDVLEHIKDEDKFFDKLDSLLTKKGRIILTLPSYQFLFSSHDIFLQHYRRYNKRQLVSLLKRHNLIIEKIFYFYTSLFVLRLLQFLFVKIGIKTSGQIGDYPLKINNPVTIMIKRILNIDFFVNKSLSKFGIHMPGLSLCCICRKK